MNYLTFLETLTEQRYFKLNNAVVLKGRQSFTFGDFLIVFFSVFYFVKNIRLSFGGWEIGQHCLNPIGHREGAIIARIIKNVKNSTQLFCLVY